MSVFPFGVASMPFSRNTFASAGASAVRSTSETWPVP